MGFNSGFKGLSAITYKQKEREGGYILPMPGLLTKKYTVNKYSELHKG